MANKASDFTYPVSLTSSGSTMCCSIVTLAEVSSNKHSIYYALQNGGFTLFANKGAEGKYNINIPANWFTRNNSYVTLQIDSYDKNNAFLSGSFAHTVLLYHPNYKNYLSTFTHPAMTYPKETCTINILPPKDTVSGGVVYDIDINYHRSVGRQTIATNRSGGAFSFIVPDLAINSSMTVRVTTKQKSNGAVLGTIAQSIKIEQPSTGSSTYKYTNTIREPFLSLPDNYVLTLSEGEVASFKGTSSSISNYKIIYAKQTCDVAQAVKDYNTASSHYAASPYDLKNKLMQNVIDNPSYYVLKDFDTTAGFITQDQTDKCKFYIKTPDTNEYKDIKDFYALQWFKNIKPGDLVYLYVIEKGFVQDTTTTVSHTIRDEIETIKPTTGSWKCRHCTATWAIWSRSSNWSPCFELPLAEIRSAYINTPKMLDAELTITTNTSLSYAPTIFISKTKAAMSETHKADVYLTNIFRSSDGKTFKYNIPTSYLVNLINQGYSSVFINTHWGSNSNSPVEFTSKDVSISILRNEITSTSKNTYTTTVKYSNNNYNNITNIPLSSMKPYIVVPPAVRPIEISTKNISGDKVTIAYANPLHDLKIGASNQYVALPGDVRIDVSSGIDINDLFRFNSVKDENGNDVQQDPTLNLELSERRLTTYEKKIRLSDNLISTIKNLTSNHFYMHLNLSSSDNKNINFKDILSSGVKVQIMGSKDEENMFKLMDIDSTYIDFKKSEYSIGPIPISKQLFNVNNCNTIHLLYNIDKYDESTYFNVTNASMQLSSDKVTDKIGWRKINGTDIGSCTFMTETFDIALQARYYDSQGGYQLRLRLENLQADSNLLEPPIITVTHRDLTNEGYPDRTITELSPITQGKVYPGDDIYYNIPNELFNVSYDDNLIFSMTPKKPYPINTPDITFSNAVIEVIKHENIQQNINIYSEGFDASIGFWKLVNNYDTFDPVQCIDVILCCYDANNNLINKTKDKRRDIYNGKEFIYYTDRKWHNLFSNKESTNYRYKKEYDMTFVLPQNTAHFKVIAFAYSNWHDNPSIYSMSNVLMENTVTQDLALEFLNPVPVINETTNTLYANSDINNPVIKVKVKAEMKNNSAIGSMAHEYNLAEDAFDVNKWKSDPIIYSNTKQFGYEQPYFKSSESYTLNNVRNSLEPLYNSIEYYNLWKDMYGMISVKSSYYIDKSDPVDINSKYSFYEDEGDKYVSKGGVPYMDIPMELFNYDRSKITLFVDIDFDIK